jgi:hypothetical protein
MFFIALAARRAKYDSSSFRKKDRKLVCLSLLKQDETCNILKVDGYIRTYHCWLY